MVRVLLLLLALVSSLPAQETAQPPLPTLLLTAENGRIITAEVADEGAEREAGLMFREKLAPDSGMLFVMPRPDRAGFWMKNTRIPLSVAFLNTDGVILEIHDLKPHNTRTVQSAFPTIAYALEMDQGWFAKAGVNPGERLKGLPPLTGR